MKLSCPTCHSIIEWSSANPYRPFCCERCRLIDLGEWLSEERKISTELSPIEVNLNASLSEADLRLLEED